MREHTKTSETREKVEDQPGESVAEDCVNWFDLPWESHCGEKCRHGLKKNKMLHHKFFFFKEHQRFAWFENWARTPIHAQPKPQWTFQVWFIKHNFKIWVFTEPFSVAWSWFAFPFKAWEILIRTKEGELGIGHPFLDASKLIFVDHILVFLHDIYMNLSFLSCLFKGISWQID